MNDITASFGSLYFPQAAIVLYQKEGSQYECYVEAYEMDETGRAVNGHPLSIQEAGMLAKALDMAGDLSNNFLIPKGLMPENVLHVAPGQQGYVLWHTPAMVKELCFTEDLGLVDGPYAIPPMLWKAGKHNLRVFALSSNDRPKLATPLFEAPLFNIYSDGQVCMGTVDVRIPAEAGIEDFIGIWEGFFFKSRFSHLLREQSPVKGNIIDLFERISGAKQKFPVRHLRKHSLTLQQLLR